MRRRRATGAPRQSPLSTTEVGARRIAWRRRRRRLRLGLVVAVVLAGAVITLVPQLRGGSHRRLPVTHASVGAPRFVVHHPAGHGPSGPYRSVDEVLAYTPYVRLGVPHRREVALTFDDGPGPYTSAIVRILERTHTPATFFVTGRQVPAYRHVIAAEARAGLEIGDHTESHPFLARLAPSVQRAQIVEDARAVHAAGAPYPRLFRPPYGSFDAATLAILHAARMLIVLWSIDTSDYARPGVTGSCTSRSAACALARSS